MQAFIFTLCLTHLFWKVRPLESSRTATVCIFKVFHLAGGFDWLVRFSRCTVVAYLVFRTIQGQSIPKLMAIHLSKERGRVFVVRGRTPRMKIFGSHASSTVSCGLSQSGFSFLRVSCTALLEARAKRSLCFHPFSLPCIRCPNNKRLKQDSSSLLLCTRQ